MNEQFLLCIAAIIIMGIFAQWFSWLLKIPSIVLLLVFGIFAGPVTKFINPDILLGDSLLPFISISVAIILFEGGLSLRLKDLQSIGRVVRNLVSIGIFVTLFLIAITAYFFTDLSWRSAILLGAILTVTGPTVIIPLLRQVKPGASLSSVLRWEGIANDPIGAMLAVVLFEALFANKLNIAPIIIVSGVLKVLIFGFVIGFIIAAILILLIKYYLVPEFLQELVTLMFVILSYVISNKLQPESGLIAVTILGTALANQNYIDIRHIVKFKENLRIFLISILFIILAARLNFNILQMVNLRTFCFIFFVIAVIRPAAVFLSTIGLGLSARERGFLSLIAPRGIVAAAISSLFSIRLAQLGEPNAQLIASITFLVVIITVIFYGFMAEPFALWLKVKQPSAKGILFIGGHSWARKVAQLLYREGIYVMLADSNRENILKGKMEGLPVCHCNVLASEVLEELEPERFGKVVAITPNDEVNSLAAMNFSSILNRNKLFRLVPESKPYLKNSIPLHLRGLLLFGEDMTFDYISELFKSGYNVKITKLTEEFDYKALKDKFSDKMILLFAISENSEVSVSSVENPLAPSAGQKVIYLARDENRE